MIDIESFDTIQEKFSDNNTSKLKAFKCNNLVYDKDDHEDDCNMMYFHY